MQPLSWGVLGTARIAREKLLPAMAASPCCRVVAVASRSEQDAAAVIRLYPLARAHRGYEALLGDPEVEAVYIPLPNTMHAEWTIRALSAGKHVLCEKPLAMSTADAIAVAQAAASRQRHVAEGFMYRHHPQWQRVRTLLDEGAIGRLQSVSIFFGYNRPDPGNIRNRAELGGGGLYDIGCYAVSAARFAFADEPQSVSALMEHDPSLGVDVLTSALLHFRNGHATFTCGTRIVSQQRVVLSGAQAQISVERPFTPPADHACRLVLARDWYEGAAGRTEEALAGVDQYRLMVESFVRTVRQGPPSPTQLADSIANLEVIEAIARSAATGEVVPITCSSRAGATRQGST
ncbi:MAG: Gfo/Idh/MocA family oxidoreductase [Alphaproteobacteria bacterium]|nr:Gfo/Idh/MocA family oxidoreductase [Alphaproteobacteria bacterium]